MLKEICFIECRLRADLTGHSHHIGHEGRNNGKEIACRAQPRIFSYNLSATFGPNISAFFDLCFQWASVVCDMVVNTDCRKIYIKKVSCTFKSDFEWCV